MITLSITGLIIGILLTAITLNAMLFSMLKKSYDKGYTEGAEFTSRNMEKHLRNEIDRLNAEYAQAQLANAEEPAKTT